MMNIERLTEEEYQAAMKAVNAIREKKASMAKKILSQSIAMMIDAIGIEQTKSFLREKNRELREGE